MLLCLLNNSMRAQDSINYKADTKTYVAVKDSTNNTITEYTYEDAKGNVYPIYISKNGRAFIIRTSRNGNEYKQYLVEEISRDLCSKLHIEYKE